MHHTNYNCMWFIKTDTLLPKSVCAYNVRAVGPNLWYPCTRRTDLTSYFRLPPCVVPPSLMLFTCVCGATVTDVIYLRVSCHRHWCYLLAFVVSPSLMLFTCVCGATVTDVIYMRVWCHRHWCYLLACVVPPSLMLFTCVCRATVAD